jgi:TatD DNase family protein
MRINIHTHYFFKNSFSVKNILLGSKFFLDKENLYSAGIHPWFIEKNYADSLFSDLEWLVNEKKIIAIGEIGIDRKIDFDIDKQELFFEKQLQIADKNNIPVIIHCVKCYDRLFFYRKKYLKSAWIVHDFNGNLKIAKDLMNLNIFISFGNNFMRRNSKLEILIKEISLDKIFFENDDKNFSIDDVYEKAAGILDIDFSDLESIIFKNFKKIFNVF